MTQSSVSVPVPTELFLSLARVLEKLGLQSDPVNEVSVAIDQWILALEQDDGMVADRKAYEQKEAMSRGLYWKDVFLQNGTQIRMKYKSQYYYAKVDGDQLMFEDTPITPSQFTIRVTGSNRNAWRDLELLRPHEDKEWTPADRVRKEIRERRAALRKLQRMTLEELER